MIVAIQLANARKAQAAAMKTRANTHLTPQAWAAAPGDRPLLNGGEIKTGIDTSGVYAWPMQAGEQTFTAASIKDGTDILAITQGLSSTSIKVLGFDPPEGSDSDQVWASTGTVLHFDGVAPNRFKTIKVHPSVADVILQQLQGNPNAPGADPFAPGAHAAAIADAKTSPTVRGYYTAAHAKSWMYDTVRIFNASFHPGISDLDQPGTLDTFVYNQLTTRAPGIFRDIQHGRIDAKTNILSEAKVAAYIAGNYGDGPGFISIADFNTSRDTIARRDLTVAHVLFRFETFRKFVEIERGPVYAAAVDRLFKDIREVLFFDEEEGDRLLVVLEGFLNMANDVSALADLPAGFTTKRQALFNGRWKITWDSRYIQEYIQTWTQKRVRKIESTQGPTKSYAAAAASGGSDPTTVSSKRAKLDTRRQATGNHSRDRPQSGGGPAQAPRPRVTKEQHDTWMASRPTWLPHGERVMFRAVAAGRPCPLGRNCRSNDAYTHNDAAKMAEVKAWAADSPYGK